jgi:hypothetical protein
MRCDVCGCNGIKDEQETEAFGAELDKAYDYIKELEAKVRVFAASELEGNICDECGQLHPGGSCLDG